MHSEILYCIKLYKNTEKNQANKKIFLKIYSGVLFLINCPTDTPIITGKIVNADQPDNSKVKKFFVLSETISVRVNVVNKIPIDCIKVLLRNPTA